MGFINQIFSGIEHELLNQIGDALTSSKKASNDFHPGDVSLESITLLSEDHQRKYDLMAQCKRINIYESILSPCIFAELSIVDSIGLYQSFPIIGEEYVMLSFKTPSSAKAAKYLLRVNKISDKELSDNNMMVSYTLQLVSAELIRNSIRYITKGYKQNIHDLVKDIMDDGIGTQKQIAISPTSGIEEGVITRLRPFEAIDFLRRRAVSTEFKSSSFTFYENRDGYHFITIEELLKQGKSAVEHSDKQFFFDTHNNIDIKDVSFRNIIAYNQVTFADTISKAQEGGISNEVNTFDLITGNIKNITYKDDGSSAQFSNADQNGFPTNTTGFIKKHGVTTAERKLVPISSDLPNTQRPEKLSIGTAFAQNITQNIIRIYIYGDSEIQVGDVIKCTLPSGISDTNSSKVARLETGNYLVVKVRHIILNTDRPSYTIALELIKGNYNSVA